MEKYVVSRDLAQRLKESGYPQQTEYMWCNYSLGGWKLFPSDIVKDIHLAVSSGKRLEEVAAPITDELLEQLPDFIGGHYWLRFTPYKQTDKTYLAEWMRFTGHKGVYYDGSLRLATHGDTPVDTLATMWLLLRDRGYPLPCGINQSKPSEAA